MLTPNSMVLVVQAPILATNLKVIRGYFLLFFKAGLTDDRGVQATCLS